VWCTLATITCPTPSTSSTSTARQGSRAHARTRPRHIVLTHCLACPPRQVPRILGPIVITLRMLDSLYEKPDIKHYIDHNFGSVHRLRMVILTDFFRCARAADSAVPARSALLDPGVHTQARLRRQRRRQLL
jgi:hypothetical protein